MGHVPPPLSGCDGYRQSPSTRHASADIVLDDLFAYFDAIAPNPQAFGWECVSTTEGIWFSSQGESIVSPTALLQPTPLPPPLSRVRFEQQCGHLR